MSTLFIGVQGTVRDEQVPVVRIGTNCSRDALVNLFFFCAGVVGGLDRDGM